MKTQSIIILTFGIVVLSGGVMGYAKANSIMSLIMGGSFGALLIASGLLVYKNSIPFFFVATFTTLFLHLFFLYRFLKTMTLMPAGIMVLLSTAVGAPLFAYLTRYVKERSVDAK